MTNLIPYGDVPSRLSRSSSRQLARTLGTLEGNSRLQMTRVETGAEQQALRTDAIAHVARRGMQNVAAISRLEMTLAEMVPMASGRLAMIADLAAISIAEVVADTPRRLG